MEKRNYSYDICRTLAILLVIICHCGGAMYQYNLNYWQNISLSSKMFMTLILIIGRIGVPLFLFLTGALILKKEMNTDNDVLSFYKKNLLPIILVNTIWIIIYNIYFYISYPNYELTIESIVRELLFIKTVPLPNMWYMPMIISMYIIIPFVAKIIKTFSKKAILIPLSILFFSYFVLPFINNLLLTFKINYLIEESANFRFFENAYIFYIIIGYYLSLNQQKKSPIKFMIIFMLSFLLMYILQFYAYSYGKIAYNVWYDSPLLFICSFHLFKFIISTKHNHKRNSKLLKNIITNISRLSLFMFFIHMILIEIYIKILGNTTIRNSLMVIILFLLTTATSLLIGYLLSKIKIVRKRALLMKDNI